MDLAFQQTPNPIIEFNGVSKTYVNGKYIGETNTHFGGYNSGGRHCTAL